MDLFSRMIVGWAMSENIDRHLVLNALDMALKSRQPARGLLHHSDRGSQYASEDYQKALAARGIQCGRGRSQLQPVGPLEAQHVVGALRYSRRGTRLRLTFEAWMLGD